MGNRWLPEEEQILRDNPTLSRADLASLPGLASHTLLSIGKHRTAMGIPTREYHREAREQREEKRQETGAHPKRDLMREWPALALSPKPKLTNPIILPPQDVVALFDIHAPFHDSEFLTRVLALADAAGIKTCILGGDIFDMTTFSKFGNEPDDSFEQELAAAENLFERFAAQFAHTYMIQGNHERRIFRTLDSQLRADRFLRLFTQADNVHVTPFEWVEMLARPHDHPWLFAHPKNASIVPGRVPSMIASRAWPDHHIASGHGHLWGMVQSDDGGRFCCDVGMIADPQRLGYSTLSVSTRPRMHQGALLVRDGYPWHVHPKMDLEQLSRWFRSEAA